MSQISFKQLRPLAITLIAVFTFYTLEASFAAEVPLLTITNEENRDKTIFVLETDDEGQYITGFFKDVIKRKGNEKVRSQFDMESIHEEGMILEQKDRHIIAKLISDNFDPKFGGDITIDTLYNGIKGKRKQYRIQLSHNGENWIVTSNEKEVNHMHMKSKKVFLIGTVGIANIVMSKK